MPYGNHDHYHGEDAGAATATLEPVTARPITRGCGAPLPEPPTCCDLLCFQRPRYFCGHLLKDTDLSTGQAYVIEKHKLYHRTLHGNGVVCGLRLTCDPSCCGYVRIGEGYAIDDCGNDIVVCETAPFDVLQRLGERGLLIPEPPRDPCDKERHPSPCPVRQCFYIVVCYQETEHEFTSPLTPACGPSPRDCEPTRIRETYAFDVVDRLPRRRGPLNALRERLECCFTLFTDHPFAAKLRQVREMVCGHAGGDQAMHEIPPPTYEAQLELYCALRGLLLLYLKQHPDQYNCRIEQEILDIDFPTNEDVRKGISVEVAFCRLITIAYNHVLSCLFGAVAFPCPEPAQASCVVLGTVEVEDGCVVRVCNCPRDYVWSFTSLFQVLIATLLGSTACEPVEAPKHRAQPSTDCGCEKGEPTQTCCRTFNIENCCEFLTAIVGKDKSAGDSALAILDGIEAVQQALRRAYDPTRWDRLPASAFLGRSLDDIKKNPYLANVPITIQREPLPPSVDPLQALAGSFPFTKVDRYVLETDKDARVVGARPVPELSARVIQLEAEVEELKRRLDASGRRRTGTQRPEGTG
jgi:hypothetical protein